jgi:hypothetical protein
VKARGVVAVAILGAWGAGLAAFARREMSRPPTERLAEVAMRVSPGVTWFSVERAGRQVGFASITIDTVPRELQVTDYVVTQEENGARRLEQTVVRLSRGLLLRGFESLTAMGADTLRAEGAMRGDSLLSVSVRRGVDGSALSLRIAEPVFVPSLVPMIVALRDPLQVGEQASVAVIVPGEREVVDVPIRIAAESLFVVVDSAVASDASGRWLAVHRDTVRAWRVVASHASAALDVWVDRLGQVVMMRRGEDGLTLRRTAYELAFENWRRASPDRGVAARANGAVVPSTLLASGVALPGRRIDSLRVRLRSAPPRETSRLGRQFRPGRVWTLVPPPARDLEPRYGLPTEARWRAAFTRHLRGETRIEADSPAVVALARRLAGSESDPARVTRALLRWIGDSLVPAAGESPAGALGTLARRRGDAGDFTRLFVALARAAGVPARTVGGVLYTQERFHYHAWAEVYLGRWVGVDPLLGQLPADAAHVPLLPDGLEAEAELLRLLGRFEFTVVGPDPSSASR